MRLVELASDDSARISEVLCRAFFDYPLMRFVLGGEGPGYARELRVLNDHFVMVRAIREEPMFGIVEDEELVGVSLLALPDGGASPPALGALWAKTWDALGPEARDRYLAVRSARVPFFPDDRHVHLDMLGVVPSSQGQGLGRRLIRRAQSVSRALPESKGVSLTTERLENVAMYERLGYEVLGHSRVAPGLATWGLFRADRPDDGE